jgi:peptidyl-prolyl cis-trans isomerase C
MKLARDRVLAELRLEQIARAPLKSDVKALAKEAWLTQPESFGAGATVVVRHVLVKGECACAAEPKTKAEQVLARARAGESFESLVREVSEDAGSRDKGGIIEVTPGARLDPAFAEAALQLKSPGDLSPVVKSAFGYHVLQLVERREAEMPPYEQVARDIEDFTERKERARVLREHTDALNSMKIEADPEAIASLRSRYPGGVIPTAKGVD